MKYEEFREIMKNLETVVEVHENDFRVMSCYVVINEVITFRDVYTINLVKGEEYEVLWIGKEGTSIELKDITSLKISEIRSYV